MILYKLENNELQEIQTHRFGLEREIQSMVENNCSNLFNLKFIVSEFTVGEVRLDTLTFDEESSSFVIIEYKNTQNYSVIDQGYSYLSVMLDRRSDFILKYNEVTNSTLRSTEIDWTQSKVIFISPSFSRYQINSINYRDVPFELYEIKKFQNNIVGIQQTKGTSNNRIETFPEPDTIPPDLVVYGESDHLERTNPQCQQLWENIKEYFLNLGDTAINIKKHYISIKRNNRAVFFTHFQANNLRIHVLLGYINPDGTRSNSFFEINDPTELGERRESVDINGIRTNEYVLTPDGNSNLDYLIAMLKQKYNSLV